MSFDTPLVEYLIIGTHTSLWVTFVCMKILNIPIQSFANINPAIVLLLLPFIYLVGMIFDDLVFRPLNPIRKQIQKNICDSEIYKDELIAYSSEELYSAYEGRVRRVRIIGAAIFNWPLLGISVLLNVGFGNQPQAILIIISSLLLCIVSFTTWKNLYGRAYKFRKNACDIIFAKAEIPKLERNAGIKKK